MITPVEATAPHPDGSVDWVYWLPVSDWDNALILRDDGETTGNGLSVFFRNVCSAPVVVAADRYTDSAVNGNAARFDLIFAPGLVKRAAAKGHSLATLLRQLDALLVRDGVIVLDDVGGGRFFRFVVDRLLGGAAADGPRASSTGATVRRARKELRRYLKNNRFCGPNQWVFVYPNCQRPWTISDGRLLAASIQVWKRATRRNAAVLKLIASPAVAKSAPWWWPYRFLFMNKLQAHD